MLLLSLLFFAVLFLLLFSLTKDTGRNTKHARRNGSHYLATMHQEKQPVATPVTTAVVNPAKVAKAS